MVSRSWSFATRVVLAVFALVTVIALGSDAATAAQIVATWIDNSNGAATTRIERRLATSPDYVAIADAPPGSVMFVDTSVTLGTIYCYRVFAYSDEEASPYSDEACATPSTGGYTVTVGYAGFGAGTITSSPAGINCGTACAASYPVGAMVTLTATPASGSVFSGWSGSGCTGTGSCIFAGNLPVTVTATFTKTLIAPSAALTVASSGSGTITTSTYGTDCGVGCIPASVNETAVTSPAGGATTGGPIVRAQHFVDLRAAVGVLRTRAGLSPVRWTDAVLVPGVTFVKRLHVAELHAALREVYVARGLRPPSYTDAPLAATVSPVRAVHVDELRAAVRAIE